MVCHKHLLIMVQFNVVTFGIFYQFSESFNVPQDQRFYQLTSDNNLPILFNLIASNMNNDDSNSFCTGQAKIVIRVLLPVLVIRYSGFMYYSEKTKSFSSTIRYYRK